MNFKEVCLDLIQDSPVKSFPVNINYTGEEKIVELSIKSLFSTMKNLLNKKCKLYNGLNNSKIIKVF